jgi:hypothetical protein
MALVAGGEHPLGDVSAPPGSAPGYHAAHHCTARGMMKIVIARSRPAVVEKSSAGHIPALSRTTRWLISPAMPPTSGTPRATTAAATLPTMATMNSTKSVTSTLVRPPAVLNTTVATVATRIVSTAENPNITLPIFTAASVTLAITKTLNTRPR